MDESIPSWMPFRPKSNNTSAKNKKKKEIISNGNVVISSSTGTLSHRKNAKSRGKPIRFTAGALVQLFICQAFRHSIDKSTTAQTRIMSAISYPGVVSHFNLRGPARSRLGIIPACPQLPRVSVRWNIRCASEAVVAEERANRVATVKNGEDSLDICRVLNGMWQTSGGWGRIDRDDAVEAMLRYSDAGLSTFDMADHYGPAEDLYGIFINRVRRERAAEQLEKVRGLTKWVPPPVKMTRSFVQDSINVSRKRMDVDCLDMLQFHWWDYANPGYLDALKHITDLKNEGKIKTVALTNFDTERLRIILENEIPVVSNQVQHSIVDMRPQQNMAELCQLSGVKLITYGTVMGGLLSEKYLNTSLSIPFAGPPLNTPSLQKYLRMVEAWGGWSRFQTLLKTLNRIAIKHGVSIPTVAVKYVLNQPAVAGSMIGVRLGLAEHIKDANAVFSLNLDEDDMGEILEVSSQGRDLIKVIGDCGDEYRRT